MSNIFDEAWLAKHEKKMNRVAGGFSPPKGTEKPKYPRKPKNRGRKASGGNPHAKALGRLRANPELAKGNHEHWEQVHIFNHYYIIGQDIYSRMAAIPNGGHRSIKTAVAIKAEGGKSGYPDIIIDKPKGVYHGMRVELKVEGKGKLSDSQIEKMNELADDGYFVLAAWGKDQAIKYIDMYWKLNKGKIMPMIETEKHWRRVDDS